MNSRPKLLRILLTLLLAIFGCEGILTTGINTDSSNCPVHKLSERDSVDEWIVLGAFDNPELEDALPDGSRHLGFYTDFLESIGGQERAVLKPDSTVVFKDADGTEHIAKSKTARAKDNGIFNLQELLGNLDNKVAYAFCCILSDKDQTAGFFFGSDDGAKV
jgi:hypothetical protein